MLQLLRLVVPPGAPVGGAAASPIAWLALDPQPGPVMTPLVPASKQQLRPNRQAALPQQLPWLRLSLRSVVAVAAAAPAPTAGVPSARAWAVGPMPAADTSAMYIMRLTSRDGMQLASSPSMSQFEFSGVGVFN